MIRRLSEQSDEDYKKAAEKMAANAGKEKGTPEFDDLVAKFVANMQAMKKGNTKPKEAKSVNAKELIQRVIDGRERDENITDATLAKKDSAVVADMAKTLAGMMSSGNYSKESMIKELSTYLDAAIKKS